jgi:hypothetical protein
MNFKLRAADSAERILPITEAMSEHGRRAKIERQHAGIATMQFFRSASLLQQQPVAKAAAPKWKSPNSESTLHNYWNRKAFRAFLLKLLPD